MPAASHSQLIQLLILATTDTVLILLAARSFRRAVRVWLGLAGYLRQIWFGITIVALPTPQ